MTMLLGAAHYLAATRRFNSTLNVIFQPAEERGFDSGGQRIVDEAYLSVSRATPFSPYISPLRHTYHPGSPCGRLMSRRGPFMAADDRVFIIVHGVGGHAARPHLAQDPVVGAASIIMALQTVVAQNIPPG